TPKRIDREPVDQGPDAAETCPQDHAGPLGELALEVLRQPGRLDRFARSDEPELDEPVRAAELLAIEQPAGIEIVHLAGKTDREAGRIEGLDRADPGAAGDQAGPRRRNVVAERGDHPQTGHDDATP